MSEGTGAMKMIMNGISERVSRIARSVCAAAVDPADVANIDGGAWIMRAAMVPGCPGYYQMSDITDLWRKSGVTKVDWDVMDSLHAVMKSLGWPSKRAVRYSNFRSLDDLAALFVDQSGLTLDILEANQAALARIFNGKCKYTQASQPVKSIAKLENMLSVFSGVVSLSDFKSIEDLAGFIGVLSGPIFGRPAQSVKYTDNPGMFDRMIELAGRPENSDFISRNRCLSLYIDIVSSIPYGDPNGRRIIDRILSDDYQSDDIRGILAKNDSLPEEIVMSLVDSDEKNAGYYAAENPSMGRRLMEKLLNSKDFMVRQRLAMNKNVSADVLERLAHDRSEWVRFYVVLNPSAPDELIRMMAENDKSTYVKRRAIVELNSRNAAK